MVEGGCMKVVKFLLFAFNLFLVISGIALIVIGGIALSRLGNYYLITNVQYNPAAILLIVVGSIILILSFLGCCGAIKEHNCMLTTFAVCLAIIFILEIAAGITGYVFRHKLDKLVEINLNQTFANYSSPTQVNGDLDRFVDFLQHDFQCCGVNSKLDYADYTYWVKHNNGIKENVPDSCCVEETKGCGKGGMGRGDGTINGKGCYITVKNALENQILIVAGVAIGLAVIQILGISFAACLVRAVKRKHQVV